MACWHDKWITTKEGNRVNIGKDCSKEVSIFVAVLIAAAVSGGVVVAAAIAVQVSGLGATASAVEEEVVAETTSGRTSAIQGRYSEAWQRFGFRQVKKAIRQDLSCLAYSTGQVRDFFLREPCRSMKQRLEVLVDDRGNTAVVSIAWVRMYGVESAIRLEDLANAAGAGWVLPLSGDLVGLSGVQFHGEHRAVQRLGSLVRFSDTVPVTGLVNPQVLSGVSVVATEFPEP